MYGRLFYFGSGAEFDKSRDIISVRENDIDAIPINDYGFAKFIINRDVQNRKNIYNMRIFGLFGKYENWQKTFISGACCKALKDVPISIRKNVYFDYLYINDFCEIIKRLIESELHYHDYNIVTGKKVDLLSIAKMVRKVSGKEIPIIICNDGLANEYTASNERLLSEIGNYSYLDMNSAIADLYKWYENNEELIELEKLLYQ
jgi:GDP-L-fucose synthase